MKFIIILTILLTSRISIAKNFTLNTDLELPVTLIGQADPVTGGFRFYGSYEIQKNVEIIIGIGSISFQHSPSRDLKERSYRSRIEGAELLSGVRYFFSRNTEHRFYFLSTASIGSASGEFIKYSDTNGDGKTEESIKSKNNVNFGTINIGIGVIGEFKKIKNLGYNLGLMETIAYYDPADIPSFIPAYGIKILIPKYVIGINYKL